MQCSKATRSREAKAVGHSRVKLRPEEDGADGAPHSLREGCAAAGTAGTTSSVWGMYVDATS